MSGDVREIERERDFTYIFANINTRCAVNKPGERDERWSPATRDRVEGYSARLARTEIEDPR